MSATYRQGSGSNGQESGQGNPQSVDADNRLHWRHSRKRLDAETFRDAVLAVSGELDRRLGGPSYRDFTVSSAGNNERLAVQDAIGPEFNRRTLYRMWVRGGTSPLLDVFDCPDPSVATPRRSVTTTPLQALTLLNDKFVEHHAERFADRLKRAAPDDAAAQVRRAYAISLARHPSVDELESAQRFVAQNGLAQFCIVLLNSSEFLYVD
jgi:hypothetical protein